MGSTRQYDFITGPQTSTKPTAGTPSGDNDTLSKGYADDTYAKLQYWGDAVADTTALKAIGSSDRSDKQVRLKEDTGDLWRFDSGSSATEDGTTIIQPTSGTGRWLICSGSGGGSGGSASGVEMLQSLNQLASIGFTTRLLDNSLRMNGLEVPAHTYFTGYLLEDYTSGDSSIKIVWNPLTVSSSDKNLDSTTGWTATGQAASLATSATSPKIGTNKFTFNKGGSGTEAGIRYDQGSQIFGCGANYRVYYWINLPSITNLTNVGLRMYADSTSNYRTWTTTTDYAGNALAVGWNLIFFDLSDTTGSSATGTGWTYSTLSRYQEIIVTAQSAQTYTAIAVDALVFSHGDVTTWSPLGLEFTAYDTSNKKDFVLDASNTRKDGPLTLGATVAQNFTGGISNATATSFKRSPMLWSQGSFVGFDTSLSSGTIATETEARITRVLRESLSGNYGAYVDMFTPQIYKVTTVGGSTIGVADSEDHSANLRNGDEVHIFRPTYSAGRVDFELLATRTMTAHGSASGGTTTLTLTTTDIAVGDYIVKKHLTVSASIVGASSNESFSDMSLDTSPNGVQLIGSRSYPNPNNVYAHWWMGSLTDAQALLDRSGNSRTLVKVGSPNMSDVFKSGKLAVSSLSTSNYLRTAGGTGNSYDGTGEQIQISFWVYYDGTNGSDRTIISSIDTTGTGTGWSIYNGNGTATLTMAFANAGSTTSTVTTGAMVVGWNHVVVQIQSSTTHKIYLNGTLSSTSAGSIGAINSAQALYFGARSNSTSLDTSMINGCTNLKLADAIVWRDGALLNQSDVNYLFNGGVPQFIGYQPCLVRSEYALTGASGKKISMKAKLNRTTSGVSPYIFDAGMIKTG